MLCEDPAKLGAALGMPGPSPVANAAMMDDGIPSSERVGRRGRLRPLRSEACVVQSLGPQVEGTSHRPVSRIKMSNKTLILCLQ